MELLTRNFSFVNDEFKKDLLKIEDLFAKGESEYENLTTLARKIAEGILFKKILKSYSKYAGLSFTELMISFMKDYGCPLVVKDALHTIHNVGNVATYYNKSQKPKLDYTVVLNLIRSLSMLCQHAYSYADESNFEFNHEVYENKSSLPKIEKMPMISINSDELDFSKRNFYYWFVKNPHIIFRIPFYQRDYVWKERNIQTFLDDVKDRMDDGHQHYFGVIAITTKIKDDNIEYKIIDGQQRLTTSLLFLKAAHDYIESKSEKNSINLKAIFDNGMMVSRYKNDFVNKKALKLLHDIFESKYDGKPHWNYELNYQQFINAFKQAEKDGLDVMRMVDTFFSKFEFGQLEYRVGIAREMDIFENMNSKGTTLSNWDLIRNQIFNMVDIPNEPDGVWKDRLLKERFYNNFSDSTEYVKKKISDLTKYTENFFTEFLYMKFSQSNNPSKKWEDLDGYEHKIYYNFKRLYSNVRFTQESHYFDFLDEIKKYSKIYKALVLKETDIIGDFLKISKIKWELLAQKQQLYFLVMLLVGKTLIWDGQNWVSRDVATTNTLEKCLQILAAYLVRLEVVRGFGHSLRIKLNTIAESIHDVSIENLATHLRNELTSEINNISDVDFGEKLVGDLKDEVAKRVIGELQNFLLDKTKSNDFILSTRDVSLEHIMPKVIKKTQWETMLKEKHLHDWERVHEVNYRKIGNLMILPKNQNSEMQNSYWVEKQKKYSSQNTPIVMGDKALGLKSFSEIPKWDIEVIEDRTKKIANILVNEIFSL